MTSGTCQYLPKIWKPIFKYLAELLRARCYYLNEQRVREENWSLDKQLSDARTRDNSLLPGVDRRLFDEEHVTTDTSTPSYKKIYLFIVEFAFEKQAYMIDP